MHPVRGSLWLSFITEPQPPAVSFSGLVAFVSPVSSKKNCLKSEPGRKTPFSGRLNGVPTAPGWVASGVFASVFALNGADPSMAVS